MESFDLVRDDLGRLVLKRPGHEDVHDVRLSRAFPLSGPTRYISIRSSEGKELILIEDIAQLPAAQRQTIEQWLDDNNFIPAITRIEDVDVRFGHQRWKVHTDRGPVEFRVQEREDIRFLPDGRFRVKDADGNVYSLPSLDQLDPASRRALLPLI